jgi:hypothetical protein
MNQINLERVIRVKFSSFDFIASFLFDLEYRPHYFDTSIRLPTRTRSTLTSTYTLPRSNSIYNYSKYNSDTDWDYLLPTRYLSSASSSRYSTYRH